MWQEAAFLQPYAPNPLLPGILGLVSSSFYFYNICFGISVLEQMEYIPFVHV
jgi:hypothetical protein